MTVVCVYRVGTEYQATRTNTDRGAMESVRCRSTDDLIDALRKWGMADRELTDIFTQLETADKAELPV